MLNFLKESGYGKDYCYAGSDNILAHRGLRRVGYRIMGDLQYLKFSGLKQPFILPHGELPAFLQIDPTHSISESGDKGFAKENQSLKREVLIVKGDGENSKNHWHGLIVGKSQAIQEIRRLISNVANSNSTVLIRGETGTGKELVARTIHDTGRRKNKMFMKVDCARLTEPLLESEVFGHGKFKLASGGTLFLDELGNTSLIIQAQLLGLFQAKEFQQTGRGKVSNVDVRIIAATSINMEEAVATGHFRKDLYYRLTVLPIHIPPLREWKEDIPLLAEHFYEQYREEAEEQHIKAISPEAMESLIPYDWPGNVRELKNLIERTMIMAKGDVIQKFDLPSNHKEAEISEQPYFFFNQKVPFLTWKQRLVEECEKAYIIQTMKETSGNVALTAQGLEITSRSLYGKMKKYGIRKEDFK